MLLAAARCCAPLLCIGNIIVVKVMSARFGAVGAAARSCALLAIFLGWFGIALNYEPLCTPLVLFLMCAPNALAAAWHAPLR